MTARLWPAGEVSQVDYEQLRKLVLAGQPLAGRPAELFARRGLAGLIVSPSSEPRFEAHLLCTRRPAWSPHEDRRLTALVNAYSLLLDDGMRAYTDTEGVL